ncbi:SpoIIIAH-like family protein [Paenibacillus sp. OV219]|uniref:SpoIIIAH-like family protein n=1 Tax=Paenibacillus sp. OV219 TaxID=1884377 RepID=UPI0008BC9153|nr:SpoIIIAH-like family protein [Paenibacillus sp. OV219]SEN18063.1 stage III sporulation protein AH [Paenibacillus sp. OV219]
MNNKRQTIWLVSMLSLMVILSAYYLFTEDVGTPSNMVTDGTKQDQGAASNATEASGKAGDDNGITVSEVTGNKDANAGTDAATANNSQNTKDNAASADNSAADNEAADNATADNAAAAAADQETLKQLEKSGAVSESVFSQMQEKRDQKFYDEYNKLLGTISDTKQNEKAAGSAVDQLNLLEDKSTKVTGLEEELTKQFSNAAVVSDENDHYKVVVQSEKLERSQAESILSMVINELGVSPDQVTIQYVK